jgi:hypothetical protein
MALFQSFVSTVPDFGADKGEQYPATQTEYQTLRRSNRGNSPRPENAKIWNVNLNLSAKTPNRELQN